MTAKQKAARAKFKQVVKEASALRKKNPKLTQAQAVKQAWAIEYSKGKKVASVGKVKKSATKKAVKKYAPKKKAATKKAVSTHKDTKSHNVNIRVVSGFVGRLIIKTYTLSELKKMNPIYFEKGKDKAHGVYKRKLIVSKKLGTQVMIEAQKDTFTGVRSYTVRLISAEGWIGASKRFDTLFGASDYVGKNIIL